MAHQKKPHWTRIFAKGRFVNRYDFTRPSDEEVKLACSEIYHQKTLANLRFLNDVFSFFPHFKIDINYTWLLYMLGITCLNFYGLNLIPDERYRDPITAAGFIVLSLCWHLSALGMIVRDKFKNGHHATHWSHNIAYFWVSGIVYLIYHFLTLSVVTERVKPLNGVILGNVLFYMFWSLMIPLFILFFLIFPPEFIAEYRVTYVLNYLEKEFALVWNEQIKHLHEIRSGMESMKNKYTASGCEFKFLWQHRRVIMKYLAEHFVGYNEFTVVTFDLGEIAEFMKENEKFMIETDVHEEKKRVILKIYTKGKFLVIHTFETLDVIFFEQLFNKQLFPEEKIKEPSYERDKQKHWDDLDAVEKQILDKLLGTGTGA